VFKIADSTLYNIVQVNLFYFRRRMDMRRLSKISPYIIMNSTSTAVISGLQTNEPVACIIVVSFSEPWRNSITIENDLNYKTFSQKLSIPFENSFP
jgi:hypothetical protein